MKSLILVLLIGSAVAEEVYQNVKDNIVLPANFDIDIDITYDPTWYKACGDPHGSVGKTRYFNDSVCFEFARYMPSGTKIRLFSHDNQTWTIDTELKDINGNANSLHHDRLEKIFIDTNIFNIEVRSDEILMGGNSYAWNGALDTGVGDPHRVYLDNGILKVHMPDSYVFWVYHEGNLAIELITLGLYTSFLNGLLGHIHEYRVYYNDDEGTDLGARAVIEFNNNDQFFFLAVKEEHPHPHFGHEYRCWHPVPSTPEDKIINQISDFVV